MGSIPEQQDLPGVSQLFLIIVMRRQAGVGYRTAYRAGRDGSAQKTVGALCSS